MKVLITGGEGLVGRHFRKYFDERGGYTVDVVDIKNGLDCREFFRVNKTSYDLVIHLAAIVGGRLTIENDPIAVATDLSIDAEFFNWVAKVGAGNVIYFSSSAAYPIALQKRSEFAIYPNGNRLVESDIDFNNLGMPDMTYGWAKLTGEFLASFLMEKYDVNVDVYRPFSGYAPDQDLDYPFTSFVDRVKRRQDPFPIWGDGEQVRDFIHMDDIVSACMNKYSRGRQFAGAYNLGTGVPTSFNQLADQMFEISGWRPKEVVHILDNPVGVDYRVANPYRSNTLVRPRPLSEGIEEALSV